MSRIKAFTLSSVATGALVIAGIGTSHALQASNSVPTSAFCSCNESTTPKCNINSALITLGKNQVFALTDVTVTGAQGLVVLADGGSNKEEYNTGTQAGTVTQAFQTPMIFKFNLTVICASTQLTTVTVDGLLITQF